jgi:hypothetical protein
MEIARKAALRGVKMKRDLDLVRSILLALEDHPSGDAPTDLRIEGYSEEQIGFHVLLMGDAGLLEVVETTSFGDTSRCAAPLRVFWKGYEFLEAARNDTIWEKAKARAVAAGVPFMFEVMKELAVGLARGAMSS